MFILFVKKKIHLATEETNSMHRGVVHTGIENNGHKVVILKENLVCVCVCFLWRCAMCQGFSTDLSPTLECEVKIKKKNSHGETFLYDTTCNALPDHQWAAVKDPACSVGVWIPPEVKPMWFSHTVAIYPVRREKNCRLFLDSWQNSTDKISSIRFENTYPWTKCHLPMHLLCVLLFYCFCQLFCMFILKNIVCFSSIHCCRGD